MDYLFYGKVSTALKGNTTEVSLQIDCDPDETLSLHTFTVDEMKQATYDTLPSEQHSDHLAANFSVKTDKLFLFTIAGQSNESSVPFEVTYAVYGGEVINLPGNDIVSLKGTVYIFADGSRTIQE